MPVIGSLPIAATNSVASGANSSEIEGISATAHIQHPVVVWMEAGLEAVIAA